MKRKILSFISVMLIALFTCSMIPSYAVSPSSVGARNDTGYWNVLVQPNGELYLENSQTHEQIYEAFHIDEHGNKVSVSLIEYARVVNDYLEIQQISQVQSDGETIAPSAIGPVTVNTYTPDGPAKKITGDPIKVTPDFKGPATMNYAESHTVSDSFGGNISITADIKKLIKAGVTFSWNTTASSSTSFGGTFTVPEGKIGYIQFSPYFNYTTGTLNQKVFQNNTLISDKNYSAWGYSPVKVGDFADGLYAPVFRNA